MELNFSLINLLILFGALQGLIFAVVLWFERRHPGAAFFGALIFALAYNGFETFNWSAGLDRYFYFFDLFPFITIYSVGPSLFLYVSSLVRPDKKITTREAMLHYAWVFVQLGIRIVTIGYHLLWINRIIPVDIPPDALFAWTTWLAEEISVTMFIAYYIASLRLFRVATVPGLSKWYQKDIAKLAFNWTRELMILMGVMTALWAFTVIFPYLFPRVDYNAHYYPIELFLVLTIYWLVIRGYPMAKQISLRPISSIMRAVDDTEAEVLLTRLAAAVQNHKLFLDPELSLSKLSGQTGIPAKIISAVLNQHHQQSFNDFINRYRLEEVKERLSDRANRHLTISGIALECGFNSQATFQRVWKSGMEVTPKQFLAMQEQDSA
jgi:AraC-like DNA-binding protein